MTMSKGTKTAGSAAQPPKQNAAQKLEALENAFMQQNAQIEILAEEIDRLRELVVALNKRLNASIQATDTGTSVNQIIMDENQKELKAKIDFLVEQGVLQRDDNQQIDEQTFVVGRELDQEANVINPRVQFAVNTVDNSLKSALMGKKAGDVVAYDEKEPSLEVTEVYKITPPAKNKNYENQQPAQ